MLVFGSTHGPDTLAASREDSMKLSELPQFALLPRPWRGAIWGSGQEAAMSRENVIKVALWEHPRGPAMAEVCAPPPSFPGKAGYVVDLVIKEIQDVPFREQLFYSFFYGIAIGIKLSGQWFAIRSVERRGQARALEFLPIDQAVVEKMLRLPDDWEQRLKIYEVRRRV